MPLEAYKFKNGDIVEIATHEEIERAKVENDRLQYLAETAVPPSLESTISFLNKYMEVNPVVNRSWERYQRQLEKERELELKRKKELERQAKQSLELLGNVSQSQPYNDLDEGLEL